MQEILNRLLSETQKISSRLDKIETEQKQFKEIQIKTNEQIAAISDRQDAMSEQITTIIERQDAMSEMYQGMKERQDEMYLILKSWEEEKMFTQNYLDNLTNEVYEMRSHKHRISISTETDSVVK